MSAACWRKGGSQILEEVGWSQWWCMRVGVVAEAEGGGSAEWLETWSRQQREARDALIQAILRRPRLRGFVELSAEDTWGK